MSLVVDAYFTNCNWCQLRVSCTGKELFPGTEYSDILRLNKRCILHLDSLAIYKTPGEAVDLISKLLRANPTERITAKEAL